MVVWGIPCESRSLSGIYPKPSIESIEGFFCLVFLASPFVVPALKVSDFRTHCKIMTGLDGISSVGQKWPVIPVKSIVKSNRN